MSTAAESIAYQGVDYMPAAESEFQFCLGLSSDDAKNRCANALFAKPFYSGYEDILKKQGRWPLSTASYTTPPATTVTLPVVPPGTATTSTSTTAQSPLTSIDWQSYLPYIVIGIGILLLLRGK